MVLSIVDHDAILYNLRRRAVLRKMLMVEYGHRRRLFVPKNVETILLAHGLYSCTAQSATKNKLNLVTLVTSPDV
jgi:hypothetical protein